MKSFKVNTRLIYGLFIVIIGILFLLDSLSILSSGDILSTYWPIFLIVVGLTNLIDRSNSSLFGFILIVVGIFYQLKLLEFININIWDFIWPVILIMVGLWLIFPKRKKKPLNVNSLKNTVIFGGGDIKNDSQNFQGGEVTAIIGGLDIDLRDSDIVGNEPVILDAFVAFGGMDIKVPDNWIVDIKGIPLFGGWDNKRKASSPEINNPKILTVKCFILFGGLEIK